MIVPYILKT